MGLIVNNVSKKFVNKKAVENISFEMNNPGVFGLLGTNGAGKTTTIRMILGIITKDSGEITWNNKNVKRKNVNFGYMPEERGVYPKTKIFDQLMYFAQLKGMSKKSAIESINKWMKRLNMEEYLYMPAEKLSKGNQQKIQFIISVMHNPKLIVLDEPFSGLDPVNTEMLKEVIIELVNEGKYIIMSSHQMNSIEEFCSDILILNKGKTILQGNLKEIKNSYPHSSLEIEVDSNIDEILKEQGFSRFSSVNNYYKIDISNRNIENTIINSRDNYCDKDNSGIDVNDRGNSKENFNEIANRDKDNGNIQFIERNNGLQSNNNGDTNNKEMKSDILKYDTDKLLKTLVEKQFKISKFELKKPSLNEIFIEKVGE